MTDITQKQNVDINAIPVQFTARLVALNAISYQVSSLHDQESILHCAITDGPAIIGADSANVWLWDADQQAPLMHVTTAGSSTEFTIPDTLRNYLNNACAGTMAGVTAEQTDASWPSDMAGHAVAFMPLPDQDGCLGVYTVQRHSGLPFNSEELLLLASLCNAVASALRNARLFSTERQLLQLLRTSIGHVVEATSGQQSEHTEVIEALLQVAEAMTQARATGVVLQTEAEKEPLVALNGPLAGANPEELNAAAYKVWQQYGTEAPVNASCGEIFAQQYSFCKSHYFTGTIILLNNKPAGLIFAIGDTQFSEEQLTSLRTIGDQIGVAVDHRLRTASNNWMLVQMANLNYVSGAITNSFDPVEILEQISAAVAQAVHVPIAFCGELLDEGRLRVLPETAIGLSADFTREMQLTRNNVVIHTVLDKGKNLTSRMVEGTGFPTLAALGMVDWACVPMMVTRSSASGLGSPVRGVLLVSDKQPHIFSERELALIATYANQAALALENSHLYARLDRQLRQMELLYHMTHAISTLDLAEIYLQVGLTTCAAFHIPAVALCLIEEGSSVQHVVATQGEGLEKYVGEEIPAETGVIGMVVKRGIPISSVNVRSDGRSVLLRKIAIENNLSSTITVPLIIGGNTLGTLTAFSQETREYSADEQQLMQSIAADAALSIQNARRYIRERERNNAMRERLVEQTQNHDKEVKWLERLLEIEYEKYAEDGVFRRMLVHIRAISAIPREDITSDNKVDIARLTQQRISELRASAPGLWPIVNISGTHPRLSMIQATALMMLISEYIMAMAVAPGNVNILDITFQQSGNDVLLVLKNDISDVAGIVEINPAITALVSRELHKLVVKQNEEKGQSVMQIRFAHTARIEVNDGIPHSYRRR